jgi:WG repeat protein
MHHALPAVALFAAALTLAAEPSPAELPKLYEIGEPVSDRRAFIDSTGVVVVPAKGGKPSGFNAGERLAIVRGWDGKFGFMDRSGRIVVEPKYQYAVGFHEGLAAVRENGLFGFINESGEMVIPPQFRSAFSSVFVDGLAAVAPQNVWGYIDRAGKFAIPPRFEKASDFREGLAAVQIEGRWGFIDRTGKLVAPPQYKAPTAFRDGIAPVCLAEAEADGCFFVDKRFAQAVPGRFSSASGFMEGLALVRDRRDAPPRFIDKSGKEVLPPSNDYDGSFHEGLARIVRNGKIGYIDRTGKEVIAPRFDAADDFDGPLAKISDQDGKLAGYIDKKGGWVWKRSQSISPSDAPPNGRP